MPVDAFFDYSLLEYFSNKNWTMSSKQDLPYVFDSGGDEFQGENDYSANLFSGQKGQLENEYLYGSNENSRSGSVIQVAASIASASLNTTLSAIAATISKSLTATPVTNDEEQLNMFESEVESITASYYGPTVATDSALYLNTTPPVTGRGTIPVTKLASPVMPEEGFKIMSSTERNCVIAYIILFCIGAPGNLFVFISVGREIWRRQQMRSRIKVLIWHLATADLCVTFVVIPIEVFWRLTIQWYGGDALCKMAQFFRAFGLYLSSMIIICISLDRFFAIVFPLKVIGGMKRVRNMLCVAWGSAILFAAPQIMVFSVQKHPMYPSFLLCTNTDYFGAEVGKEIMYNLLSLIVMYFAPLLVIIVTYAMVLYTITRKSREHHQDCRPRSGSNQLRRSDNASNITRARRRTLWLSMVIVTVFLISWTPYVTMTLWYIFDWESADKLVDPRIHDAFFVAAVSNSCANPIIYGNYMKNYWKNLRNAACRSRNSSTSSSRIASSARMTNQQYQHHQRGTSTYRCTDPNHLFSLTPRCRSSANASDVTIVLKEFPT